MLSWNALISRPSYPLPPSSGDRSVDERDYQRFGARQGWSTHLISNPVSACNVFVLYCKGLSPHIWDPTLFGCSHTVALVFVLHFFICIVTILNWFDYKLYLFRFCRIVFSSYVLCLKWSRSVHAHDIKTVLFRFSRLNLIWRCIDDGLLMLVHIFRPDYVPISALFWYYISMEF